MTEREPPHPDKQNRESRPPSRLVTVGLALLTLSALYLLGPAHAAMDWAAAVSVLAHIGLGLLLTIPITMYAFRRHERRLTARKSIFGPAFGVCALTGLVLTVRAASGVSAAHARGIWWAHVFAGFVAVAVFGAVLMRGSRWFRRRTKRSSPTSAALPSSDARDMPSSDARDMPSSEGRDLPSSEGRDLPSLDLNPPTLLAPARPGRFSSILVFFVSLGTLGLGGTALLPHYDAAAYYRDTTATNAAQAENPLFPANIKLSPESSHAAADAEYCGRSGCHATALREWQGSVHQQAATDPVYQRVRGEYAAHNGETAARWCAGCHEPLRVVQEGDRIHSAQGSVVGHATREGVGCVGCHAVSDVSARTGNGRFTLSLPQNYPYTERQAGWPRRLHDFLLRVRPAPHQAAYLKPEILASSEFCGTCHRQSFNVPQNGYQLVHGSDEWGTWQSGPFSGRAARTAGLRTEAQHSCRDCHFPLRANGTFSHASPAAGLWLSALAANPGSDGPPGSLLPRSLSVDIFALRHRAGDGRQEEWIAPLDAPTSGTALRAGETCLLDIVVSNRSVGHEFPAGYQDIQEAWLEVTLHDGRGRILAESGRISKQGETLPADTHSYRMVPLDRSGNALEHHELWRQVTTATRRTIPSGGADIARYRLSIPRAFAPPLAVQARLRFRSQRPDFARWVGLKSELLVVTLAEAKVVLPLSGSSAQKRSDADVALRFVEYGLGLLAPKDAPDAARARRAFLAAQQLAPNRPEPFLGLGRAYLAEPELLAARAQFDTALRLAPENPAAQADLGVVYGKQGEYDRALNLLRPLALLFPQDSALQFDLGLTLFRSGNYAAAVTAFENSLAADPDNAAAHFQLKQCFQHLQRVPEARREEAIGQYLAEDRLFPLLVPPYLLAHPHIRQAAQPIPEHLLRPPGQTGPGTLPPL
jgi:tetratricopeptide (TPR) repeat protein